MNKEEERVFNRLNDIESTYSPNDCKVFSGEQEQKRLLRNT